MPDIHFTLHYDDGETTHGSYDVVPDDLDKQVAGFFADCQDLASISLTFKEGHSFIVRRETMA